MKKQVTRALLFALLLALAPAGRTAEKKDKQKEAAALLARAVEVSNIRCEGCPPFRLRAGVRVAGLTSGQVDGSYLLVWASPHRWREEITFPGFSQLRVAGEGRLWRRRNLNYLPFQVEQLSQALTFVRRLKLETGESVKKIWEQQEDDSPVRCVELKPRKGLNRQLCLDSGAAVLRREDNKLWANEYADFGPLGERMFPRQLRVTEGDVSVLELQVQDLSVVTQPEQTLFARPEGLDIQEDCEDPKPAELLDMPVSTYAAPPLRVPPRGLVAIYGVIGTDGKLGDLHVLRSAGAEWDAFWLTRLRHSRYRPRVCNGVPVPEETILQFWPLR